MLNVAQTRISDTAVEYLNACPQLTELNVRGTATSRAGVDARGQADPRT